MGKFDICKQLIDVSADISEYFYHHTDDVGRILCRKHKVEHLGKTAYVVGINDFLYTNTRDKKYLDRVLLLTHRLQDQLESVKGSHNVKMYQTPAWNMSSNIIDIGSIVDILSLILERYNIYFSSSERKSIKEIIYRYSSEYLTSAVVEKEHTNQRLWGATGLSNAYHQMRVPTWKKAVLDSINKSCSEIRKDGSIPYITAFEATGHPSSVNDVSCNYHSRHVAYILYALEKIEEFTEDYINKLKPAADFLMVLYGEPGIKIMSLETKRWYFLTDYEIASNVFDVYVFAKFYQITREKKYALYGRQALEQVFEHITASNGLSDHKEQNINFLCSDVTSAHMLWLVRASALMAPLNQVNQNSIDICDGVKIYPDAGIATFQNHNYKVMVRGSKQPFDAIWGSRIGGGSIVYLGNKLKNGYNLFNFRGEMTVYPGSFFIQTNIFNPINWFFIGRRELAALLFHVRIELRAKNYAASYKRGVKLLKALFHTRSVFSSTSTINVMLKSLEKNILICESGISNERNQLLSGIKLQRTYQFLETEIKVEEYLRTSTPIKKIAYRLPRQITDLQIRTEAQYRRMKRDIIFQNVSQHINITYTLVIS